MLATFCLRLALGMAGSMLVLGADVAPRFYRVQFLVILGLLAAAVFFFWPDATLSFLLLLFLAMALSFAGSLVWMLEGAPLGRSLMWLTAVILAASVVVRWSGTGSSLQLAGHVADDWTSAALLGSATSAMLMGHSYLIAPGMSISPLIRLLVALFASVAIRMLLAGAMFWSWNHESHTLADDLWLWLPLRWLVGFVGPLVLGWMAWRCAGIRSTQSATGILYVVVVLCFIGELTGELLHSVGAAGKAGKLDTMKNVAASVSSPSDLS
jgi:hypothetical protein